MAWVFPFKTKGQLWAIGSPSAQCSSTGLFKTYMKPLRELAKKERLKCQQLTENTQLLHVYINVNSITSQHHDEEQLAEADPQQDSGEAGRKNGALRKTWLLL